MRHLQYVHKILCKFQTDLCTINFQFRKKTLGYDKVNVTAAKTLSLLYSELHTTAKWYPGEGEPVIDFLVSVTSYLQKSYNLADLDQTSNSFDNILRMLLENDSVVNEKVSVCVFKLSDFCGSIY